MLLPTKIKITADSIIIGRFLPIEIFFQNIDHVRLAKQYPRTMHRVYGTDFGYVKKGIYETPDGQQIRLHIFLHYPPYIEVIHKGGLLVFNSKNPDKTAEVYSKLEPLVNLKRT